MKLPRWEPKYAEIYEAVMAGASRVELAERYGLVITRIHQIVWFEEEMRDAEAAIADLRDLFTRPADDRLTGVAMKALLPRIGGRLWNAICNDNHPTLERAVYADSRDFRRTPNLGKKAYDAFYDLARRAGYDVNPVKFGRGR